MAKIKEFFVLTSGLQCPQYLERTYMGHNGPQDWYLIWPQRQLTSWPRIPRYGLLDQFSTSHLWRPLEANEASEFISFLHYQINEVLKFKTHKSNDLVPVIVIEIFAFYHNSAISLPSPVNKNRKYIWDLKNKKGFLYWL